MSKISHFTTIKTKITDKECLIEALQNLNYVVKENVPIRGYSGRKRHGDVVVKTGQSYDVGFIKNTDSFSLVADWYGATRAVQRSQQDFLQVVQKEYATQKVVNAVTQKGYRIQSRRTTKTGEIKLVVVNRGWSR